MKIEILIFDGGSKKYQETPPPKLRTANELAITRKWASLNSIFYTKWLSPLVALIAWLGSGNYMKKISGNNY